jgi:hypothetical protein
VGEGPGDEVGVDGVGAGEGIKGGFHGEGVGLEPVEECGFAEEAGVGMLRRMGVCI